MCDAMQQQFKNYLFTIDQGVQLLFRTYKLIRLVQFLTNFAHYRKYKTLIQSITKIFVEKTSVVLLLGNWR